MGETTTVQQVEVTNFPTTEAITLPSGEIHISYQADLGQLLISLLLFTLIVIQSFKWANDVLRERKHD